MILNIIVGMILIFALLFVLYFLLAWADTRPCSYCAAYKEELEKRVIYCDDCLQNNADVLCCKSCFKKKYKKKRINRLMQVFKRIRRRKNK